MRKKSRKTRQMPSGNEAARPQRAIKPHRGTWLEMRDELPRNPLGKILKREPREELRGS
jgi:acyl-CoA synthetase (AMP-forming)/AMP-acid ligase II